MPIITWIMGLVGPIAIRALVALGFSAVSFAAVNTMANALVNIATTNWASMPATVLALATLSGIPQVLGMIAAAYLGRVSIWAVQNGTKYLLNK